MARKLSDVLASGEIPFINSTDFQVGNNIKFDLANTPDADGMFVRFGLGGLLSAYRAIDQDLYFTDQVTNSVLLTETMSELLSLTLTEDLSEADSSYQINFNASNSDKKPQDITVSILLNGSEVRNQVVAVGKEETNQLIVLSGAAANTFITGSVLTVGFVASKSNSLTLNGDLTPTEVILTKAKAAPV